MYSDDDKEVDMLELGTKIIGNFGAMIPLAFGEVVTIETFDVGPRDNDVKVVWDNGSHTWMMMSEIDAGDTNRAGMVILLRRRIMICLS